MNAVPQVAEGGLGFKSWRRSLAAGTARPIGTNPQPGRCETRHHYGFMDASSNCRRGTRRCILLVATVPS